MHAYSRQRRDLRAPSKSAHDFSQRRKTCYMIAPDVPSIQPPLALASVRCVRDMNTDTHWLRAGDLLTLAGLDVTAPENMERLGLRLSDMMVLTRHEATQPRNKGHGMRYAMAPAHLDHLFMARDGSYLDSIAMVPEVALWRTIYASTSDASASLRRWADKVCKRVSRLEAGDLGVLTAEQRNSLIDCAATLKDAHAFVKAAKASRMASKLEAMAA